jgi:hypothetical protein
MKKVTIPLLALATTVLFTACGDSAEGTKSETKDSKENTANNGDKKEAAAAGIIAIPAIQSQTPEKVEAALGKAESTEPVKGYPCKNAACEKRLYQSGKFEVLFKEGKADRITINQAANLTSDENALAQLGLPTSAPTFKNAGNVQRWSNVEGLHEVSFFPDYILVQVSKPE